MSPKPLSFPQKYGVWASLVFAGGFPAGARHRGTLLFKDRPANFNFNAMKEKIGFVGVGRMGANMARRLGECGYRIAAVYDVNAAGAAKLARELGARHARTLAAVTAASDIVFTVVTDDAAQLGVFAVEGDSLLVRAR